MKLLAIICVVLFDLTNCQYVSYPSGVEVWVQKVQVSEVNELGEEVQPQPYRNIEGVPPLFPTYRYPENYPIPNVRHQVTRPSDVGTRVKVWVQKVDVIELPEELEGYYDSYGNPIESAAYGGVFQGSYCPDNTVRAADGSCLEEH